MTTFSILGIVGHLNMAYLPVKNMKTTLQHHVENH